MGHEAKIDPPRLPWVHSASYWRRRDLASPQTDVAPPPGNRGALTESADIMPNTSRGLSLPEGGPCHPRPAGDDLCVTAETSWTSHARMPWTSEGRRSGALGCDCTGDE